MASYHLLLTGISTQSCKDTTMNIPPTPLSPESLMIFPHLERLTTKGWWTVGSQPAINGAPSTDDVVGWGPRGGYVYQKCFVEFFVEQKDVERIVKKIEEEGGGWVSYFAGNVKVSRPIFRSLNGYLLPRCARGSS